MSRILSSRNYATTSLATFLLVSACVIALCFVVDPFRLYPSIPRISPGTHIDLLYFMRLHTPYAVKSVQPDVLVMGSSRSSVLPPRLLAKNGETAYNASLTGASLGEVHQMIEHAHAQNALNTVLIGVDQQMFWQTGGQTDLIYRPDRYERVNPGLLARLRHFDQQIEDRWQTLYSVDALTKVWTLLFEDGASRRDYRDDGTWDLFDRRPFPADVYYSRALKNRYRAEINENIHPIVYDQLRELLAFTRDNNIAVTLFITPQNGLVMETLNWAGNWQKYLQWQQDLVTLVENEFPETSVYGVEDQASLVLEPVEASPRLFHDGLHYSRLAANEIVTCLVEPCTSGLVPTRLDADSIASYLQAVDSLRDQYVRDNQAQLVQAREWLQLKEHGEAP